MKTSNYILISFFVFLFSGIFLLFLSSKFHVWKVINQEFSTQEKSLGNFSVVVGEPGAKFHLKKGENPSISSTYQKPDSVHFPPFGIRNDTLFVFSYPANDKHWDAEIYCKGIKTIVGKENSYIKIKGLISDSLMVHLNKAEFDCSFNWQNNGQKKIYSVDANESKVNFFESNLDNLEIHLNKTKMTSWNNSIDNLSGVLKNHSSLMVGVFKKISLDVDSTSTYRFNK